MGQNTCKDRVHPRVVLSSCSCRRMLLSDDANGEGSSPRTSLPFLQWTGHADDGLAVSVG